MKKHGMLEILTGLFVIILAILFSAVSYFKFYRDSYASYNKYYALFDNVDGVVNGGDLKVSGVKVGYISDLSVDVKTQKAKLGLMIEKNVKIPKDSRVKIISESLLGGKYVAIEVGWEEDSLKPNETIVETTSSVNLEELLGKFIFSGDDKEDKNSKEKNKSS